jgi:hypothetical protein
MNKTPILIWEEFFSVRNFCRSNFFTKIFIVRIIPSNEEKQSGPKVETWQENKPDIFHRKKTTDIFAIKSFPIFCLSGKENYESKLTSLPK